MASNPVLRSFEKTGRPGVAVQQPTTAPPTPSAEQLQQWYREPSAGDGRTDFGATGYAQPGQTQPGYPQPGYGQPTFPGSGQPGYPGATPQPGGAGPVGPGGFGGNGGGGGGWGGSGPDAPARYLTLDDVVTRTVVLLGALLAAGAATWFAVPDSVSGAAIGVGFVGALVLGLYVSFTGRANAGNTIAYSVFEGVALGGLSKLFEQAWPGIVVQAVLGTILVAGAVLVVYKTGAVKVTPRFTKIVLAATLGVIGLVIVNAIASLFTSGGLGLRDGGGHPAIAIGFSLLCIVIAASNLIVDFEMIQQSVRRGVDERVGWYLAFGVLVTLVWLYLEILRLLSYLNSRN